MPWLADDVAPGDALPAVLAYPDRDVAPTSVEADAWDRLPPAIQRLVVRVFIGTAEARPWLHAARQPVEPELARALAVDDVAALDPDALYAAIVAPWNEERAGQVETLERAAFRLLDRLDRIDQAHASIIYLSHLQRALDELEAWRAEEPTALDDLDLTRLELDTALGPILLLGPGDEEVNGGDRLLVLDLGGQTTYRGRHAAPIAGAVPTAALIDLGGDDLYDGGEAPLTFGSALLGIGALYDLDGDDTYRCEESCLGAAWFGTGLLVDRAGNDTYDTRTSVGQGAAIAGVGALLDLAGDDRYVCAAQSQGYGSTLAAGLLIDPIGNDTYTVRDDGNVSELYLGQAVAMSQGCGHGRRADLGDGHSLAGGFGVFVDGAGDDHYHAQVWAQGVGYWWGVGLFEDRGGNDVYRNGKYSLGAAAHFAVGVHVDLSGDDRYNLGNDTAVNQYQGHARDGGIGVSFDGAGDDHYRFRNHCGGSADLASIGLFWDRSGDDVYEVRWNDLGEANGWNETPPMGSATRYPPFRSFRDDLLSFGAFVDTGGRDDYRWDGPPEAWLGGDGRTWHRDRGPRSWSVGIDTNAD